MKIDELELSVRTYNCLKRVGIDTVEKLLTMSDADLMKIRCFGEKCLIEVHEKIRNPYGVNITPAVPGPVVGHDITELCFRNGKEEGRKELKAEVLVHLLDQKTKVKGLCHAHVVEMMKFVEGL